MPVDVDVLPDVGRQPCNVFVPRGTYEMAHMGQFHMAGLDYAISSPPWAWARNANAFATDERHASRRVGFVHHYHPLSAEEQAMIVTRHWAHLHLDDRSDYTKVEAFAAIARITGGNFRLTGRLLAQVLRILEINQLTTVTAEVVEAARGALVIGSL